MAAAVRALVLALAFRAGAATTEPGVLNEVVPCPEDKQRPQSLCVIAKFGDGGANSSDVACLALEFNPQRRVPPNPFEWFSVPRQPCDRSKTCKVRIFPRGLKVFQPGNTYDVFCLDMKGGLFPGLVPALSRPQEQLLRFLNKYHVVPDCADPEAHCGLRVTLSSQAKRGDIRNHESFGIVVLSCAVLLMAYVGWSFVFDKVRILHETGAAVLLGFIVGETLKRGFGKTVEFSYDTFSYVMLPMVIFAAGYNLEKQHFFRYIGYILTLGVTGTVLIFVFIYYGSEWFEFHPANGDPTFKVPATDRLVLASVLSSTDSVAPMAFLATANLPQVYTVAFGEGVFNDVVAILLSTSVEGASKLPSFPELALKILELAGTSSVVGVSVGLATSLLFKSVRPLQRTVVKPVVLLLGLNYACYIVAEVCDFSSILALFISAVITGHYAHYSLSVSAQAFARELAELMAYSSEAVVFGYFGLSAAAYTASNRTFYWSLIWYYILCIICARMLAIIILALVIRLLKCGAGLSLTIKELFVVAMAGCMRGTIAYALILRGVPPSTEQTHNERLMVTTVLGIVLVNCLVFGGLFPMVLKLLRIQPITCESSQPEPEGGVELSISPSALREGVQKWWQDVDGRFLQPIFRSPGGEQSDVPQ